MNDWLREFPVCHPAYTVYCTVHTSFHWLEHSIALKTRDKISEGTISCKPKEAQSFIFFCNSAHSIGDLILNYGSEYQKVMTAWKCMSPAQTCPLNSRLIYPTARLTSPLGSLIIITDFQVPNGTPDLIPALLPYLKKWQFHSSSCSDLSLSYSHLCLSRKSCWLLSSKYTHNLTISHHLHCNFPGLSRPHQSPR